MRAWLLALLVTGCAVGAPARDARDPASAAAPAGRLAGPPPSLRAGVVTYPDLPSVRSQPQPHDHHQHGAPAPTPTPAPAEHDHGEPAPAPAEHDHHHAP